MDGYSAGCWLECREQGADLSGHGHETINLLQNFQDWLFQTRPEECCDLYGILVVYSKLSHKLWDLGNDFLSVCHLHMQPNLFNFTKAISKHLPTKALLNKALLNKACLELSEYWEQFKKKLIRKWYIDSFKRSKSWNSCPYWIGIEHKRNFNILCDCCCDCLDMQCSQSTGLNNVSPTPTLTLTVVNMEAVSLEPWKNFFL